jgi:hypothetical protein
MKGTISVFLPTVYSPAFYRPVVFLTTAFFHTLSFVQSFTIVIFQRAAPSIYSRCIVGCTLACILSCFVFASPSWAIDDEAPELVMTGKQTHYKSTQTNDTPTQTNYAPKEANSRQFMAVRNSQPMASKVTKPSVLSQGGIFIRTEALENLKKSGETHQMFVSDGVLVSSTSSDSTNSDSTNIRSTNMRSTNIRSTTEGSNSISSDNNGDIKNFRSQLRLRKHSAVRGSKSEFMRMCLINDCFAREGKQNFLVR